MRVVQVILILAFLFAAPVTWGQTILANTIAVEWANIASGQYGPEPSYDDFLQIKWYDQSAAKRGYLKFPKVQAPSGHTLASARLYLFAVWPVGTNGNNPNAPECDGIQGWEIDNFGSITGANAPAPNIGPAPVDYHSGNETWYDVTQIALASYEALYIVLSPSWTYEQQETSGWSVWSTVTPGNTQFESHVLKYPRIVYTFMEDGVKRVEITVGALKAGYGSE